MSIKPIRLFGDPVLREKAQPVKDFDKELRILVKDLQDTRMEAPRPGLAAPVVFFVLLSLSMLVLLVWLLLLFFI